LIHFYKRLTATVGGSIFRIEVRDKDGVRMGGVLLDIRRGDTTVTSPWPHHGS